MFLGGARAITVHDMFLHSSHPQLWSVLRRLFVRLTNAMHSYPRAWLDGATAARWRPRQYCLSRSRIRGVFHISPGAQDNRCPDTRDSPPDDIQSAAGPLSRG